MKFSKFEFDGFELKLMGYSIKQFDISSEYNIMMMENSIVKIKNDIGLNYGIKRALKYSYDIKLDFSTKGIVDVVLFYNQDGITGKYKFSFYNLMGDNNIFCTL